MALTGTRLPRGNGSRVGRTRGKFTQFRRLDALRDLFENQPLGLTLAELAVTLRISERSVRRYLREMREPLQLEFVEPVPGGARVWRMKPGERARSIVLRRAQAQALLATRTLFEPTKGSAFFDEVALALGELRKLTQRPAPRGASKAADPDATLHERVVFLAPPGRIPPSRAEEIDVAIQALTSARALTLQRRGDASRSVFFPYGVVFDRGSLVLVGWLEESRGVVVLPLEATSKLELGERKFQVPDSFELSAYLHGDLGVAAPSKARLLVEFDARVADVVRARKVHPAQRVAVASDGRVRVSAPLGDRERARAWVLGFGDAAKVVEPADLADELRETLLAAAAKYT
ncbi:MAG TPA: WYL domain-containing protein [Polyangiaceae bacterium]|nr:WYL domain-containing protein [Polyangiaceae bacterium]